MRILEVLELGETYLFSTLPRVSSNFMFTISIPEVSGFVLEAMGIRRSPNWWANTPANESRKIVLGDSKASIVVWLYGSRNARPPMKGDFIVLSGCVLYRRDLVEFSRCELAVFGGRVEVKRRVPPG